MDAFGELQGYERQGKHPNIGHFVQKETVMSKNLVATATISITADKSQ
jgi:hypothetical protein